MSDSDRILRGVKTRLLISYPFFGSALSDLRILPARDVKRFHSNGPSILYNEEFLENSNPSEIAYWLCREILQLTMGYGDRKKHRSRLLWAVAAEYCVNSILAEEGLANGIQVRFYRREFTGKSAEEIYTVLVRESISQGILDGIEEIDNLLLLEQDSSCLEDWQEDLRGIARVMKLNAENLKGILEESQNRNREYGNYRAKTLEIISKAKLSERTLGKRGFAVDLPIMAENIDRLGWEDILSAYVFNDRRASSYRRFRRKYVSSGIYLPQRFHLANSLVACIDVSASISEETVSAFFSDILYLISSRAGEVSVRLIQIDARIQSDVKVDPLDDPQRILRRKGFGGTDFTALFRRLQDENNRDPVIIFTDGRAIFPEKGPEGYDVLWVTTDLEMPWGINIPYGGNLEAERPH